MQCFHPVILRKRFNDVDSERRFPCGHCLYCRSQRTNEWTVRMLHESTYYSSDDNWVFVTLTYSNEYLPSNHSLSKSEAQLFLKRLRYFACQKYGKQKRLRYFLCGEYGDPLFTERPHYHLVVFGLHWQKDQDIFFSAWKKGFISFSLPNQSRLAYLCKYLWKQADENKQYTDRGMETPFSLKSLGLGKRFLMSHIDYMRENVYTRLSDKFSVGLPRYYVKKISEYLQDTQGAQAVLLWRGKLSEIYRQKVVDLMEVFYQKLVNDDKFVKSMLGTFEQVAEQKRIIQQKEVRYFRERDYLKKVLAGSEPQCSAVDKILFDFVRWSDNVLKQQIKTWQARDFMWRMKSQAKKEKKYENLQHKRHQRQ